jgi:hypothetical protein
MSFQGFLKFIFLSQKEELFGNIKHVEGQCHVGAQDYDYAMSILHNDYRVN